jgi:hypothetical protein
MITLDQMIEAALEYARNTLINKPDKQIPPTFVLVTADDEMTIIPAPWKNSEQRSMALNVLKFTMKRTQVVAYSVVSEAWMAREPKDPRKWSGKIPSEHPNKKEVILIIAVNKIDRLSIAYDIVRGKKDIVIDLIKFGEMNKENLFGDLITLLDD